MKKQGKNETRKINKEPKKVNRESREVKEPGKVNNEPEIFNRELGNVTKFNEEPMNVNAV